MRIEDPEMDSNYCAELPFDLLNGNFDLFVLGGKGELALYFKNGGLE